MADEKRPSEVLGGWHEEVADLLGGIADNTGGEGTREAGVEKRPSDVLGGWYREVAELLGDIEANTGEGGGGYVLPTMDAETKGGAKLGDGLSVADDALSVDYSEVASKEALDTATALNQTGGIVRTTDGLSIDWTKVASAEDLQALEDAVVDLAADVTTHESRITATENRLNALQSLRKDADGYYVNETVTAWLARKFDGKIYGYSEPKATATKVTKTGANAGLPNPTLGTLTERGESVYRDIGPTQWYAAKGYVDADGVPHIKVIWDVDTKEDWDACKDNVWSLRPVVYYSVDESGVSVNGQLSDTWHQGMRPNPRAYLPDGTLRPYMLEARHGLAFEDGVGVSKPGLKGYGRDVSHNSLITKLDYANTGYSGKTEYEQWYENFMLRIIYGTKNSQSVMTGCTSYSYQYNPAIAETGVKRVILTNAQAANLVVGSTMMLGTHTGAQDNDRSRTQNYDVFDGLKISSIETYDSANKAVYFDTEETFDTDTTCLLSTVPWHTGSCGEMDWDGTPTAAGATSGKEPMFFQGCELMNGNYEVLGNVILSSDGETGWIPYVNGDTRNEATSVTSDYVSCETSLPVDANDSWKYPLYLSERNGLMYGTQTGGSQSAGVCDGHYTNKVTTAGTREWRSLGSLYGGGDAGLACVGGSGGLSVAAWGVWARLSGVGRSKLSA